PAAPEAKAEPAEAKTVAPPAKGLGLAAGAKRPGAKKTAAPAQTAATPDAKAEPAETKPASQAPVKGLGIAAGAKRPGAKKTAAKAEAAPTSAPAEETKPQPQVQATPKGKPAGTPEADEGNGETLPASEPVKGLGIARGARPPGKR
ncbi:MAG: FeS-binding protein, partial [Mycobacterium sp.]